MLGTFREIGRTFEKQDRSNDTNAEADASEEWGKSAIVGREYCEGCAHTLTIVSAKHRSNWRKDGYLIQTYGG